MAFEDVGSAYLAAVTGLVLVLHKVEPATPGYAVDSGENVNECSIVKGSTHLTEDARVKGSRLTA